MGKSYLTSYSTVLEAIEWNNRSYKTHERKAVKSLSFSPQPPLSFHHTPTILEKSRSAWVPKDAHIAPCLAAYAWYAGSNLLRSTFCHPSHSLALCLKYDTVHFISLVTSVSSSVERLYISCDRSQFTRKTESLWEWSTARPGQYDIGFKQSQRNTCIHVIVDFQLSLPGHPLSKTRQVSCASDSAG